MPSSSESGPPWDRPVRFALVLVVLAVGLNLPYLWGGFAGDDLLFIEQYAQDPLPFARWRGPWSNDEILAFRTLWWREAAFSAYFWRPIPGLLIEGSLAVFGRNAVPLHLVSLLAHGGVAALIFLLVRRLGAGSGLAALSGLLFVICEDHSMGVGWIATITDMLCVLGVMTAFYAQVAWLQTRRPGWLLVMLLSLGFAFGCKESAATAPLIMLATAFFFPQGKATTAFSWRPADLAQRLLGFLQDPISWMLPLGLLAGFLALYKGLALGGSNNLMYVDPLSDPLGYLAHLVVHLPIMWLGTLTVAPIGLSLFVPGLMGVFAALGALAFASWLVALWGLRPHPLAGWAFVAYLIALLPQASTDASERALYFPHVGASILLAMLLLWGLGALWGSTTEIRQPRWVAHATAAYVALGVALPGLVMTAVMPSEFVHSLQQPETETASARAVLEQTEAAQVYVLNTSGAFVTFYTRSAMSLHAGRPVDVRLLSSCWALITIERLDDRRFILRADRRGWVSNLFARAVRVDPILEEGATYAQDVFDATLRELTPDHRDVLAVEFDVHAGLDDPSTLFLTWNGEGFVPLDPMSLSVGEMTVLADTSDVMASFF